MYVQMHILWFRKERKRSLGFFLSDWSCHKYSSAMSQYVTFDLLGTFQLPHPFTIRSFEVKVASLHTGLKSDYPTIDSQSDVSRSDCRPPDVNQSVPHHSLCSCTVQVLKTDTPRKSVKSNVKPRLYDSPVSVQCNSDHFTPHMTWNTALALSVTSLCLSSWAAGSRRLLAAVGLTRREAAGARRAHCWDSLCKGWGCRW